MGRYEMGLTRDAARRAIPDPQLRAYSLGWSAEAQERDERDQQWARERAIERIRDWQRRQAEVEQLDYERQWLQPFAEGIEHPLSRARSDDDIGSDGSADYGHEVDPTTIPLVSRAFRLDLLDPRLKAHTIQAQPLSRARSDDDDIERKVDPPIPSWVNFVTRSDDDDIGSDGSGDYDMMSFADIDPAMAPKALGDQLGFDMMSFADIDPAMATKTLGDQLGFEPMPGDFADLADSDDGYDDMGIGEPQREPEPEPELQGEPEANPFEPEPEREPQLERKRELMDPPPYI